MMLQPGRWRPPGSRPCRRERLSIEAVEWRASAAIPRWCPAAASPLGVVKRAPLPPTDVGSSFVESSKCDGPAVSTRASEPTTREHADAFY